MRPLRVVLDTNVLLSALLFRSGRLRWIEPLWVRGQIVPLVSKATTEELIRVLEYPKFRLSPLERQTVLEAFLPFAEAVFVEGSAGSPPCRDPHDVPFLALVRRGHANYLVSGDADLLSVKESLPFSIVTPEAFKTILNSIKGIQ